LTHDTERIFPSSGEETANNFGKRPPHGETDEREAMAQDNTTEALPPLQIPKTNSTQQSEQVQNSARTPRLPSVFSTPASFQNGDVDQEHLHRLMLEIGGIHTVKSTFSADTSEPMSSEESRRKLFELYRDPPGPSADDEAYYSTHPPHHNGGMNNLATSSRQDSPGNHHNAESASEAATASITRGSTSDGFIPNADMNDTNKYNCRKRPPSNDIRYPASKSRCIVPECIHASNSLTDTNDVDVEFNQDFISPKNFSAKECLNNVDHQNDEPLTTPLQTTPLRGIVLDPVYFSQFPGIPGIPFDPVDLADLAKSIDYSVLPSGL
jgi:hypothetical protein